MVELLVTNKSIAIIFQNKALYWIVTNKSIAIIFQNKALYWKIAFGENEKKVFSDRYTQLEMAVAEVKRLGFGGYTVLPSDFSKRYRIRCSLKSILLGKRVKLHPPVMFENEKNWRAVYQLRHANT